MRAPYACPLAALLAAVLLAAASAPAATLPFVETFDDDPTGDAEPQTQGEAWTETFSYEWTVQTDGTGRDYRSDSGILVGGAGATSAMSYGAAPEIPGALGTDFTASVDFEVQSITALGDFAGLTVGLGALYDGGHTYWATYHVRRLGDTQDLEHRLQLTEPLTGTPAVTSDGALPSVVDGSQTYTLTLSGSYATPGDAASDLTLQATVSDGVSVISAGRVDTSPLDDKGLFRLRTGTSATNGSAGIVADFDDFRVVAGTPPDARSLLWGVKSAGDDSEPAVPPVSGAPATLFSFDETGGTEHEVGAVVLEGAEVDVDALAVSPAGWLYAFELNHTAAAGAPVNASRLVRLDPMTAQATAVGPALEAEMRGAAIDLGGTLWALDAAGDALVKVDRTAGTVGDSLALTLEGNPYDLSDRCDLAFDAAGQAWVVDRAAQTIGGSVFIVPAHYLLDLASGDLTFVDYDDVTGPEPPDGNPISQIVGTAFSPTPGFDPTQLFCLDVASDDDVFRSDTDGGFVHLGGGPLRVLPGFDAGRGDLGAAAIPEPATLALVGLGAALALGARRRRGR